MLFYPSARGCSAPAAVQPSWALPNQAFSSVSGVWANKQWSTIWNHFLVDSGNIRSLWLIQSTTLGELWGECFPMSGQQILQKLSV
jgi:hypothetical protein